MPRDIRIQPNRSTTGSTQQPTIFFSGTTAASINLKVEDDGSIVFEGNNGGLFNITDSKDGLLSSVNDVSGLPIFAVYSSDKVIAGGYNQNALIVDTDKVFIGSDTRTLPSGVKLAVSGNTLVNGTLSASTLNLFTTPTLNNSNTQILSRNSSTGVIEFSTLSAITTDYYVTGGTFSGTTLTLDRQNGSVVITGFTSNNVDTYTTGFTYNDNNKLTISQNQGQPDLNVYLNTFSGLTINGNVSISGSSQPNGYALSITGDTNFIGDVYVEGDLTYNGNLLVTGGTIVQNGLTANTVYTDYIDFNTNYTGGTTQGRINWDSGTGTLNIGVGDPGGTLIDLQVGQEEVVRVYNDELTTLNKGELVYVSGSQGNRPAVKRAIATSDGYSVTTLGMVDANINSGDEGYVTTFGIISNLNTLGLTGGTPIFLSPTVAGGYTSTKPQAPEHIVLIGYVVRVDATVGSVFVNISNGWELNEIHDVRISGVTTGDLLMYSSYSGSPLWVNTKTLQGDYTINGELTITGTTNVSYIDFDTTLSGTTSTEGRLFWDVNNRTLSLGMIGGPVQQIGEEQYYLVEAASTILDGKVVGAVGTTGVSGKILADYIIADGSVPAITTLGILTQTLSAGTVGYVTSFGLVRDLDTTGTPYGEVWNNGDILYISPTIPGGLTKNKPNAPNLEIVVALVIYSNVTNGSIFVRPSIAFGLDQINGVSITGLTNYDILQYNSTNSLWENTNSPILNTLTINSGITINNDLVINYTPQTNNTINDFLVRESNGDVSLRSFNSINYTPNLITVSLSGGSSDFTSIKLAVDSITAATSNNPYTVKVGPGVYYENNPINLPSWVALVGDDSISTIIEAVDPNQTLFYLGDQSAIFDCQIQGVTGTGVSAIVYSSSTTPQSSAISYVENVRFGTNYTHAKVIGSGSANIIMQCSNVKYGGYPFTIGFEATNDGGSAIGRMQLRNVTSTNGGVTSTTGLTFAKADKPNCGFIVNGCLLTKAQGSPAGTGFYVENGAFLRLTGVNFQRWLTGIHAPQIGSAPSIDAIALNFENCTTDVNIVHSGTTGKIQGTDNFLKTNININAPLYEVNQDPRVITVAKKGGDFSSIKSAVDYLILSATTSSDSRYVIQVGPGTFIEDEIDLTQTPYVSVVGSNIQTTQIIPSGSTHNIIKIGQNNEISFLSLGNAGPNQAAVYAYDIGDFGQLHKISIYDCDIGILVESVTQDTKLYAEYVDMNGEFSYGTQCIGNNGYLALANLENYYLFPTSTGNTIGNYVTGSGATINITSSSLEGVGVTGSTAILSNDGSIVNVAATDIMGWGYGLEVPNVGLSPRFEINGTTFLDNVWDINVLHQTASGVFQGISSHEKVTTVSTNIYWSFLDSDDGELDITRKASVTFTDGSHTDFTTLIFEGSSMGLLNGGSLTTISGTTVQADGGFGYVEKSDNSGIVRRIDWDNSQIILTTNSNNYIYIDENGSLLSSGFRPNSNYNIILGRVVTNSTDVEFVDLSPFNAEHTSNRFSNLFSEALGPIYAFGSIVTQGTTPLTLDVTAGEYYFSTNEYLPTGGSNITFTQYYETTGSTWVTSSTTIVNNTQYNTNSTLTGLTSGYYTKHTLYLVGDGVYENYFLVLGQNEYSTLVEAENALLPTPPSYFSDSVVQIANIYVQQGFSGITQVEDIRPTIAFRAGGVNASSVHGNLLGLTSDDHPQYLLVDGTRSMVGSLDMGTNNIISAGTINNVTIQSHATRHQFGGSDPVGLSTPSANAIPYADSNGLLDSWISTASTTTFGLVKTSTSSSTVISNNDAGYLNAITGFTFGDNVLTGFTVNGSVVTTTINATGGGLVTKANTVTGTSFTGNPKKYNVVFTTSYPNTNYSIQITGAVNRSFTYESKTTTGFTINTNANTTFTENVDWVTTEYGES